jgi:aminopeptidase N
MNQFHYQSSEPIPFRFAVASAKYAVASDTIDGHLIEVYYHPDHARNVAALVAGIKQTMTYCERNFSPYAYDAIRFVEISSFTQGFAATAYPGVVFMNEQAFHVDITADKQQDIVNQLAGHELSHEWWGVAQLIPENRQGGKVLTETLAMYTELMLYKHAHGREKMEEMVGLFRELYESGKGFSENPPLFKVGPEHSNISYNKGLLVMYEIHEMIGEEKINMALKRLLEEHAFPNPPATSLDLIEVLCTEVNAKEKERIEALFMEVELP